MKTHFPKHKDISIIFLIQIICVFVFTYCHNISNEQLIVGNWKLESLKIYMSGEETIYKINKNSYITADNGDEFLQYHNKGPVTFWFNKYGERIIKDKDGNIIEEIGKFRVENDKIFFENPKLFQKIIGKESIAPIELLNKNHLRFSFELSTFNLDPSKNNEKWVYVYNLSRIN